MIEPESRELRSIFAVHRSSDVLRGLCGHPRLVAMARQLLGGEVYIHQSRINYKSGFRGKEFFWHSDFETWHVEDGVPAMRTVSCSISLTPNTEHNGPLMLMPGSHHRFVACVGETPDNHYKASLKRQEVGVPDDASLTQLAHEFGISFAQGPGRVGDVLRLQHHARLELEHHAHAAQQRLRGLQQRRQHAGRALLRPGTSPQLHRRARRFHAAAAAGRRLKCTRAVDPC